jgi:hypothetical protein
MRHTFVHRERERKSTLLCMYLYQNTCVCKRQRERERVVSCLYIYINTEKREHQIDLIIMDSNDGRKSSLWNLITSEPLYIIIPNLFIIRPIRFLFNYYIKPAKFLVIILPRNIWKKGNIYVHQLVKIRN